MAVRDQVTKFDMAQLFLGDIVADGTTNTASVDGAHVELGLSFFMQISGAYTDGDFTLSLEESDDDATWAAVPAKKIIHPDGLDDTSAVSDTLSAQTSGANMAKIGIFSNMRYVRAVVTAATVTTGAVGVQVMVAKHGELVATPQ